MSEEQADALRLAQLRLHRAIAGGGLVPGLRHLSRAAQESERATQATVRMWRERPEEAFYADAEEKVGLEALEHFAGSALVIAQKQISLVIAAIVEISKACEEGGHGRVELAQKAHGETVDVKLRRRVASIELINIAANFWKHGHQWKYEPEDRRKVTEERIRALGIDSNSPTAFEDTIKALDLGLERPNHNYLSLWAEVKQWGEALLLDLFRELEKKGVLMLTTYSATGGEVWRWKRDGIAIVTYEIADLYRGR